MIVFKNKSGFDYKLGFSFGVFIIGNKQRCHVRCYETEKMDRE